MQAAELSWELAGDSGLAFVGLADVNGFDGLRFALEQYLAAQGLRSAPSIDGAWNTGFDIAGHNAFEQNVLHQTDLRSTARAAVPYGVLRM